MKILYRISPADYQEAQRLIRRLSLPIPHLLAFIKWMAALLFAALVILLLFAKFRNTRAFNELWTNVRPFLVLLLVVMVTPILLRITAARTYKRNAILHRNISVELNEAGYEAEDGLGARTALTWDYFDRFLEGKRVFVLRSLSKVFTIVSKSSMSAEDLTEFRALLMRRIVRR